MFHLQSSAEKMQGRTIQRNAAPCNAQSLSFQTHLLLTDGPAPFVAVRRPVLHVFRKYFFSDGARESRCVSGVVCLGSPFSQTPPSINNTVDSVLPSHGRLNHSLHAPIHYSLPGPTINPQFITAGGKNAKIIYGRNVPENM